MSSPKVMPASESKSGKIYANSEQRQTLMAVYLTDNYPDTSILQQVSSELGFSLDWVRQWFMYTRKVMRKQGKEPVQANRPEKAKDPSQPRKRKRAEEQQQEEALDGNKEDLDGNKEDLDGNKGQEA